MTAAWRARNALVATFLGFSSIWVLVLIGFLGMATLTSDHTPAKVLLGVPAFLIFLTGAVTLAATLVFILPYVSLRSSAGILQRPWRMYVEPCIIALMSLLVMGLFVHPMGDSALYGISPLYSGFAVPTSLASSFFFLRRLRRKLSVPSNRASSMFDKNPTPV